MSKTIKVFLTLCMLATLVAGGDGGAAAAKKTDGRARRKIMLDNNFMLRVGQEVLTADGKLKLKFVSVPEDSRCPKGVNCIWAGNARVMLHVGKTTGKLAKLELNTNPREATDAAEGDYGLYRIKLVGVAPYPVAEQTIEPQNYTVTLIVSKKS